MKISQKGIDLIKEFEGFRSVAYQCQALVWSIGYGSTKIDGKKVKKGDKITKEKAEKALQADVVKFENTVNKSVKVELTQEMFDALVSFTYNVGGTAFKTSTLLRKLNKKDYIGASNEFLKWNKYTSGGKKLVSNGLTRRRKAEQKLFLSGGIPKEPVIILKDGLSLGDIVKIKEGAKDLNSKKKFAKFVYKNQYKIISLKNDKVVFGIGNAVTGVVKYSDVTKVK